MEEQEFVSKKVPHFRIFPTKPRIPGNKIDLRKHEFGIAAEPHQERSIFASKEFVSIPAFKSSMQKEEISYIRKNLPFV